MHERLRPLLLRTVIGLLIGFVIWAGLGPIYHRVIAAATGVALEWMEQPRVTDLHADGNDVVVNRLDFPRSSPRPAISLDALTYNIILLTGLFAMAPRPLSDRNVAQFIKASLVLAVIHVLALITQIESIYALHLGRWSEAHYGAFARNAWGASAHFYNLFGVHAAAFALWLLFSDIPVYALLTPESATKRRSR